MQRSTLIFALCALIGLLIWVLPHPIEVSETGWRSFAIFVATIIAIMLRPLPMGAVSLISLSVAILTGALTLETACRGFSNEIVWLVVFAFFIAKGFLTTRLSHRVAFSVMSVLGKNSLGLGYGIVATDLMLAPCIPSLTARAGGIVFPILRGLVDAFTGPAYDPKMGTFLALCAFQGTAVTSAMFVTAMAGNPLMVLFAQQQAILISWSDWAVAALVPGLLTLLALPYLIYRLYPPSIHQTPHARSMALRKLHALGPMSGQEKWMTAILCFLLILWIFGRFFDVSATTAALGGVSLLLLTGILKWKDILEEHLAWDTLIWFSTLVTLASQLNQSGLIKWFSTFSAVHVQGINWGLGFFILVMIYFYTHYFFASSVAHIGAMFAPFLTVSIALGTPPLLAALVLGFTSNLYTGLTHYGSGPAPIFFGAGYLSVREWWRVGFLCSLLFIVIWSTIGVLWWRFLGFW